MMRRQTYDAMEYTLKDSPDADPHGVFDPKDFNMSRCDALKE